MENRSDDGPRAASWLRNGVRRSREGISHSEYRFRLYRHGRSRGAQQAGGAIAAGLQGLGGNQCLIEQREVTRFQGPVWRWRKAAVFAWEAY